jgi:hypothetical protein
VHENAVAANFEELMNDNEKRTGGLYTAPDNAVLIRFRVLCFYKQKRANSVAANKLNKLKRKDVLASKEEPPAQKMSPIESPPSVPRKEAVGFPNCCIPRMRENYQPHLILPRGRSWSFQISLA